MEDLHRALRRARERARYSQDDVGAALGVSRAMVSYWEKGSRRPNDRQLTALARLYGLEVDDLVRGREPAPADVDLAGMMLRAEDSVDSTAAPGLREFVRFLDTYAELSALTGVPIRGLTQSPFVHRQRFEHKDDARRKAEEVRSYLGLGSGPVFDLDTVCEMLGITVYRASLGGDLSTAPSGAFLNHGSVGFSILVNLDMTPGRRSFTVVHEIAHALFHSDDQRWILSRGRGPREVFADQFAGEFLMPSEGARRFIEEAGMPRRLTAPVDVIHVQRHFRVSFPTALVRLRQMNALTAASYGELRQSVRPVALARSLGYEIDPEEYRQDAEQWRLRRFPRRFLRMLRTAFVDEVMTPPSAAAFAGLSVPEVVQVLGQPLAGPEVEPEREVAEELKEFEDSGVVRT